MQLDNRECSLCSIEGIPQAVKGHWIVVCGNAELCGGILADETEATPYVTQLETVNANLLEALEYGIAMTKPNENGEFPYLSRHIVETMNKSFYVFRHGKIEWHKHWKQAIEKAKGE